MHEWITSLIDAMGYSGIAGLMLAENIFPPIPSELIMPLAGFLAANEEMSLALVVLAGATGSCAGATVWYYIGHILGKNRLQRLARRYGRWAAVTPDDIEKAYLWFQKHGGRAVFLGRMVPGVRTYISVPAGLTGMGMGRFLLYTYAGSLVWTAFLTGCGYILRENYQAVAGWLDPAIYIVLAITLAGYLYKVARFRPDPHEAG